MEKTNSVKEEEKSGWEDEKVREDGNGKEEKVAITSISPSSSPSRRWNFLRSKTLQQKPSTAPKMFELVTDNIEDLRGDTLKTNAFMTKLGFDKELPQLQDVHMEGYLEKRQQQSLSVFGRRWQKRWFSTCNFYLNYYSKDKKRLKLAIDLRQLDLVKYVEKGKFNLYLGTDTDDARVFELKAKNKTAAENWIAGIEKRLERVQELLQSLKVEGQSGQTFAGYLELQITDEEGAHPSQKRWCVAQHKSLTVYYFKPEATSSKVTGSVRMDVELGHERVEGSLRAKLRVRVLKAENLVERPSQQKNGGRKMSSADTQSEDLRCCTIGEIKVVGEEKASSVKRTSLQLHSLEPAWDDDEPFEFDISDVADAILDVQLWDMLPSGDRRFLGKVSLPLKEEDEYNDIEWFDLLELDANVEHTIMVEDALVVHSGPKSFQLHPTLGSKVFEFRPETRKELSSWMAELVSLGARNGLLTYA